MAGPTDRSQPPHVQRWQSVLNEHWPTQPLQFKDRPPGIAVRARVQWERDGEEYLFGVATRWDTDHVYVQIRDTTGRLAGQGVWLKPADVYRMGDPTT